MPRRITVTFDDGSSHVYENAPDDITPEQVTDRAQRDFGKAVVSLDGGRKPPNTAETPSPSQAPSPSLPTPYVDPATLTPEQLFPYGNPDAEGFYPHTSEDVAAGREALGIPEVAPQQTPPQDKDRMSNLKSFGLGFGDSLSYGFGDEILAGIGAFTGGGDYKTVWKDGWDKAFANNVEVNRANLKLAQEEDPWTFAAGGLTSAVVPGSAAGGILRSGNSIRKSIQAAKEAAKVAKLSRAGKAAVKGAAHGAVYGLGTGEGSVTNRLDEAGEFALYGAAGGVVLDNVVQQAAKALPSARAARFVQEQSANPFVATDAKVADDVSKIVQTITAGNANRKLSAPKRATLLSRLDDLEASYLPVDEVKALDLPPSVKARLNSAMAKRHLLSDAEVAALRDGTPAGDAVADGIEQARRLRTYVSETTGSSGSAGRFLAEALGSAAGFKLGGPIGGAVGGKLGKAAMRSETQAANEAVKLAKRAPLFAKVPEVQAAREAAGEADSLSRLSGEALDAEYLARKASQAEAERLAAEGGKVAKANARDNIRPSGGWRGMIYERTGLLPAAQDAGAIKALKDGAITPEQFNAFLDDPSKLMSGNAGNALVDRLASYADNGSLDRDPRWPGASAGSSSATANLSDAAQAMLSNVDPRTVQELGIDPARATKREIELLTELDQVDPIRIEVGGDDGVSRSYSRDSAMGPEFYRPEDIARAEAIRAELAAIKAAKAQDIRNPIAYRATAEANQRRVTEAVAAVRDREGLSDKDREALATAISRIGNTSSREEAQSIAIDALDRLGADSRDYARSILSPLVAQIKR